MKTQETTNFEKNEIEMGSCNESNERGELEPIYLEQKQYWTNNLIYSTSRNIENEGVNHML